MVTLDPVRPAAHDRVGLPLTWKGWAIGVALATAIVLAYANTLNAPMEFDDKGSLLENPSILRLWPPSVPLSPPGWGLTVQGRPLLNYTFAINYALGGFDVRGYHLVNLLIHVAAALMLFGLIRRTLAKPVWGGRFRQDALPLAGIGAAFWALHPLQVESVTYLVQRAESLAGLLVIGSLYGFARATEGSQFRVRWAAFSVGCCCGGMATKEVVVVAPLLVWLYDRTLVAGGFQEAWRQRRSYYGALAGTWVLLVALVWQAGTRGGTFDVADPMAWWRYGLTQLVSLMHYLRAAIWPSRLAFDYGTFWVTFGAVWWQAIVALGLIAAIGFGLRRRGMFGFLGSWFLLTLAPSSLVPGTIQMTVDHRMYLPLLAFAGMAVIGLAWRPGRVRWIAGVAMVSGLAVLTFGRNRAYRSEVALWTDTVAKTGVNARAIGNLGSAWYAAGRYGAAELRLVEAARLDPANPEVHFNLGLTYLSLDRPADAERELAEAVRLKPQLAPAYFQRGMALMQLGRATEAIDALQRAVAVRPRYAEAHCNLGVLLADAGRRDEAIVQYLTALEIRPDYAEAEVNLGVELLHSGRPDLALERLQAAILHDPKLVAGHYNLGQAFMAMGQGNAAVREYEQTLRLDPAHGDAHLNLGIACAQTGQMERAIAELKTAIRLLPASPEAHQNLGIVLAGAGRLSEAEAEYRAALRLRPMYAQAHYNYGNLLLTVNRVQDAEQEFERALACDANLTAAREMLDRLHGAR